jgi:adenosylhomocysteine nucleosidase
MALMALLSALADEQRGFLANLETPVCVERAGRKFWQGRLFGQPVVLALSRIGKVAAATTATALIEHFGVDSVVFTGVAGGVGPGVAVGDVVVAHQFLQHDMDASPLFPRYELPLYGQASFACDAALTARLQKAVNRTFSQWSHGHVGVLLHTGLIVSGDQFVSSQEASLALVAALQCSGYLPLAVEMEGAAVAQVCHDYQVPFAAFRTISDRADDAAHLDFSHFVTQTAGPLAFEVCRHLLSDMG